MLERGGLVHAQRTGDILQTDHRNCLLPQPSHSNLTQYKHKKKKSQITPTPLFPYFHPLTSTVLNLHIIPSLLFHLFQQKRPSIQFYLASTLSLPKSSDPTPPPSSHLEFIFLNAAAHLQKTDMPPTPPLTPHVLHELPANSYKES